MDFFGFFIKPMPFFPYPGIRAFLIARLALPVVLALKLFFKLGFLIPNFMGAPYDELILFISKRCTDLQKWQVGTVKNL